MSNGRCLPSCSKAKSYIASTGSPAHHGIVLTADTLINDIGIYGQPDILDIHDRIVPLFCETNAMSRFRLARHHMPAMLKRNGRRWYLSLVNPASPHALSV